MTEEADGFVGAILAAPDDDAVRLVFSDWLEEHGEPDRAELIRVQCALATARLDPPRRELLLCRERELLAAHELEWVGPLRSVVRRAAFVRGFVERVTVHAHRLPEAAALFASAAPTVRHLILLDAQDLAAVAALSQLLRRITTLELRDGCTLDFEGVRRLFDAESLSGLAHLVLRQRRLEGPVFEWLANAPGVSRLRTLDLYGAELDLEPLRCLASSPHLAGLTTLVVSAPQYAEGVDVSVFAEPGCRLVSLRRLHLSYCGIDDDGARALARSPHLTGLERLSLAGNPIGRAGRRALKTRFGDRVCL